MYLIILFLSVGSSLFSQNYKYTLSFGEVHDMEAKKAISQNLYNLFDVSAEFDETGFYFTVYSEVDILETTFIQKMNDFGYTVLLFEKQETTNNLKE